MKPTPSHCITERFADGGGHWTQTSKRSCAFRPGVSPYCTQHEDINFTVFADKFKHRHMSQISSNRREARSAGISQSAIFKFSRVPKGQSILVAIILSPQCKWNGCVFFLFFSFFCQGGRLWDRNKPIPLWMAIAVLTAAPGRLWVSLACFSKIAQ